MAAWVAANDERLRAVGDVQFRRSDNRTNPSAHLVLSAGDRRVEMLVWDSREVELLYGTPADPHNEHYEVNDPAELDVLREQLLQLLA